MMRRFTSAPKPRRACASYMFAERRRRPAAASRSARRRSARGWSWLRRSRRGSRSAMAYSACGRSTSTSVAPSARERVQAASKAARTSASTPGVEQRRAARRCAGRATSPVSAAVIVGHGRGDAVESRGSLPAITRATAPRRAHGARERADLIERRGEGDQAVARDAAVGRLEPDDAAERRRLADRAAGVGAERERRHAAPPPRPPIRRSSRRGCGRGPRVARRAERAVLGRRAHRELVAVGLADDDRAGRSSCSTTVASYGDRSSRASSTRPWSCAARAEVVLERDRDAVQRPREDGGCRSSAARRASAPSGSTVWNAWSRPSTAAMRSSAASQAARPRIAGENRVAQSRAETKGPGHSLEDSGTLKSPAVDAPGRRRDVVAIQRRHGIVVAPSRAGGQRM